jgi:hypothetical protein
MRFKKLARRLAVMFKGFLNTGYFHFKFSLTNLLLRLGDVSSAIIVRFRTLEAGYCAF